MSGKNSRLVLLSFAMIATDTQNAAAEPVTMLDPVFVEASSTTGTPWQYVAIPGFEIISRCPGSFNDAYVEALERARTGRLALLPGPFWGETASPIAIVLYDREPEKSGGLASGRPIDLSWAGEDGALLGSKSAQLTHPVMVGDGDTFISCGNYWDVIGNTDELSVDVDSAVRLAIRAPRFPAWFVAGLEGRCGLLTAHRTRSGLSGDSLEVPNALWTTSEETLALQNELRKQKKDRTPIPSHRLLPLADLFAAAPAAGHSELWEAEAGLLVRWGLFKCGDRPAFLDFIMEATRHRTTEAMFRSHLGIGYREAEAELRDYLPVAASEMLHLPLASPTGKQPVFQNASALDVARIIGGWARLEARPSGPVPDAFEEESLSEAGKLFSRALLRHPTEPRFLASYGLFELQAGDTGAARTALEAATRAGVLQPRAYVELARLRLGDALPFNQGGTGDLTAADFEAIKTLLTTARFQMPSLPATYSLLARLFEHAPAAPAHEDLRILGDAVHLFPQNASLAFKVATLYRKAGYPAEADSLAREAQDFAESEHDRALLAAFLAGPYR